MKQRLTNSIDEFRKKYGESAYILEEDFDFCIKCDYESLENDPEVKQRCYLSWNNKDHFSKFLDYLNAVGYKDMFVLDYKGTQFYAYPEYVEKGKKNILKYLSGLAKGYRQKAEEIEALIQNYSY